MQFFRVKNWDRHQHYKDRNPPWIKVYNELLDDFEFSCLQDASKLHLFMIWMLASRTENRIPWSPKWIMNKCSLDAEPDLNALLAIGMIEKISNENNELQEAEHNASNTIADRKQSAIPETEEETEGEKSIVDSDEPTYLSAKGRKLQGDLLDWFNQLWDAFAYKNGKADAADAFLDRVKLHGRDKFPLQTMIAAAKAEAVRRKKLRPDQTPIMLQGWLSKRRDEDRETPQVSSGVTTADWQRMETYANSTGTLPEEFKHRLDECPEDLRVRIQEHLQ